MALGNSLHSNGMRLFATVLAGLLVGVWILVFSLMLRALYCRRLLWPGAIDGAEASQQAWAGQVGDATVKGIKKIRSMADS